MRSLVVLSLSLLAACSGEPAAPPAPPAAPTPPPAAPAGPDAAALQARAAALFQPLPEHMGLGGQAPTPALVTLGKQLYFEKRLSKNHDISCNSCHDLAKFGVDGQPTSPGHKGQLGGRNSPTSLNAALHIAQFWDGRAADVEAQAKGPVLNPGEMAMPDEKTVVAVLKSIPDYGPLFTAAFPDAKDPVTYDNMAAAIGAFERTLVTPAPFDAFLKGDAKALSDAQLTGLQTFMDAGCTACHNGVGVGGAGYFKVGLVVPYETADEGRKAVTGQEADKFVFKAPSLRNIEKTAPYFHDGKVATLDEAIRLMGKHQLGKDLKPEEVSQISAFLGALTGTVDPSWGTPPAELAAGPKTPAPDPS